MTGPYTMPQLGGGEFRVGVGVQDSYTLPLRTGGIFFTFPGIDKGPTTFSVSSERHWQSGVNGIAKVPKRSCRSGIRTRPGPPGRIFISSNDLSSVLRQSEGRVGIHLE